MRMPPLQWTGHQKDQVLAPIMTGCCGTRRSNLLKFLKSTLMESILQNMLENNFRQLRQGYLRSSACNTGLQARKGHLQKYNNCDEVVYPSNPSTQFKPERFLAYRRNCVHNLTKKNETTDHLDIHPCYPRSQREHCYYMQRRM